MDNHNELLTTEQAAAEVFHGTISPVTLQWWRAKGRGPRYLKISRRVVYRRSDLEAYIAAGAREPESA